MDWELIKVKQTDWIQDNSEYYTLINYIGEGIVRLDVMGIADSLNPMDYPIISFQGKASDVRKHIMQWIGDSILDGFDVSVSISLEHAAYIGSELARCELLKTEYIQD